MKFIIRIAMENDAFTEGNEGAELARILRKLADSIESAGEAPRCFENIRDVNGNTVGQYAAKPADYA